MSRNLAIPICLFACAALAAAEPAAAKADGLSAADRAAGWTTLFDGQTSKGWRAYRGQEFPKQGWQIDDGCLKLTANGGGGDIVTDAEYGDFELELEWRVAQGANSGIIYRVSEKEGAPWQTGPEYQLLDDANSEEGKIPSHTAGAMFDLYAPAPTAPVQNFDEERKPIAKPVKPAGEWNQARIRIKDSVVQHWLNGVKLIETRLDDAAWRAQIAKSKFRDMPGFGLQPRGHIVLQDHGDEIWFRNIRVRDLSAPLPNEVVLFNGRDLTGWTAFLPEGGKPEDTWHVKDGVLICRGQPAGYIHTDKDYTNYVLKVEWRWNPETKQAGNSGVLLRVQPPDKVWPRSVEAQLQSANAGDFWNIGEFTMKAAPERTNGRNTKKLHLAERPLGEWNEYEITVDGGHITLKVNGELLNEATDVEALPGKIALQSEGTEIHFRSARLAPLP